MLEELQNEYKAFETEAKSYQKHLSTYKGKKYFYLDTLTKKSAQQFDHYKWMLTACAVSGVAALLFSNTLIFLTSYLSFCLIYRKYWVVSESVVHEMYDKCNKALRLLNDELEEQLNLQNRENKILKLIIQKQKNGYDIKELYAKFLANSKSIEKNIEESPIQFLWGEIKFLQSATKRIPVLDEMIYCFQDIFN